MRIGILVLLVALTFITVANGSTLQGSVAHTGNFSADHVVIPKLCWKAKLTGLVGASPVYSDGKIYVTNWYGWGEWTPGLYCLDAATGEILWRNSSIQGGSTPSVVDGKIVVGGMVWDSDANGYLGHLYIVNASNGLIEHDLLLDTSPSWWGIASTPLIYNGYIYVLTHSNGTLWKVSMDGEIVDRFATGGQIGHYTSPAAYGGRIFFAGNVSGDNRIHCVDEDFNELWNESVDAEITNTPTAAEVNGEALLIFATEKSLYVYTIDGVLKKRLPFNGTISSAAVAYGNAYIGSKDGKLYCLNLTSFDYCWTFEANGKIDSSPAVADGVVYFATNTREGTVYAVDAFGGKLLWYYRLKPPENYYYNIMSSPFIAENRLFIGADSGYVYCFDSSGMLEFNVTLIPGRFSVEIDGRSYEVDRTTALGALYAASQYETDDAEIRFEVALDDSRYEEDHLLNVSSIMGIKPTPDWSRWWSIWNETSQLSVGANQYFLSDDGTIYYCYGDGSSRDSCDVLLKINADVKPAGVASLEASNGNRGGNVTAWVNVTAAKSGWYVVVVSGVGEGGDYVAGVSTFHLNSGEELRVPVLIHVPQRNEAGSYKLYAGVYEYSGYPGNLLHLSEGVTVEVS